MDRLARKDDFTTKCIVVAAIFKNFACGMIPVAVDKINKMAEFGSLAWKKMRFVLLDFFNNSCIIK